jgi:hypothetical protein
MAVEREGRLVPLNGTGAMLRAALRIRLENMRRRLAILASRLHLYKEESP